MPTAPPSRCTEQQCANHATYKGKCDEHYIPWKGSTKRRRSLYPAADLARWADAVKRRDPVCRSCGEAPTTEADHIIPITDGGAGLDLNNGQGLCSPCHQTKTSKEIGNRNRRRARRPPPF